MDDVGALLKDLEAEHAALSTEDCTVACRALASIQRAANKICSLEPGIRCGEARAKAEDAGRRVRDACPDCAVAAAAPREEERRAAQPAQPAPPAEKAAVERSAPSRGGCASCSAPGAPASVDLGALFIAAWAASRVVRRRR